MHRAAAFVLASLVLLGASACDGASVTSEDAPGLCPQRATCVAATGDFDGDGEADQVASYYVGEELAAAHAGVVVVLADGRRVVHEYDRWTRSGTGGLVGVGALDDLPGDEIVAATSSAPGGAWAIILHWVDGQLAPVPSGSENGDPFSLDIGTHHDYAGGLSCDDTDGDGRRDLQLHSSGFGDPSWRVSDYRWVGGRLERREHQPEERDDTDHLGIRCDGFERFGIDDIANRPEPAQPLCPRSAKCQTSHGDIDGDGRDDDVTYYELVGAEHEPIENGVVVGLADGQQERHPFVFPADEHGSQGGLAGIAPVDDLPGEEIVALVQAGAHGRVSRLLHWVDGDLEEVVDPEGGPLALFTDGAAMSAAGFSCDATSEGGPRGFQVYDVGHGDGDQWDGKVITYRWAHGRLEEVERTPVHATDDTLDFGRYAGNRCQDVSDYPDSAP